MRKVSIKFAYDLNVKDGRVNHPKRVLFQGTRLYWPDHVYIQTTNADGMVFKYAHAEWKSEFECELDILSEEAFAIQATIKIDGFGQAMCRADNRGELYSIDSILAEILFDVDAAFSETQYVIGELMN